MTNETADSDEGDELELDPSEVLKMNSSAKEAFSPK